MKKGLFSKKIWVMVLVTTAILLAVGGTLAIYTSQVYQRAVVRNRYNDVIRFSSDKLYRGAAGPAPKYYYPMDQGQTIMTFSVCNYDQAKNTLFNEKTIDYTITFKVTNGTAGVAVSKGNQQVATLKNGESVPIENNRLPGGQRSVDSYSVSFNENDYNKVEIEVTVTPADAAATTQGRILNAVLIPIEYATTQGVRVNWEFTDRARGTPDQFDAYNLLVSVSGGARDVVIAWDVSKLDIDPFFVTTSNGKPGTAENGYKTLTVPMNSEDATGTYLISFYNHNTTNPEWATWDQLPISVQLDTGTSGS